MIRVLRRRLVAVTVILLTLVLSVALCLLMSSVYRVMEADSLDALQHAGMRYGLHAEHSEGDNGPPKPPDREEGPPKRPGDNQASPIPCFEVGYDHQGQLYADGPGYYDLTDLDYLEALLQQTAETQQDHGILLTEQMRFLKLDDICGEAYQNAVLHITQPGNYTIEGKWHGQIWVDLENYCEDPFTDPTAKVNLILNGVTIDCTVAAGLVFYNVYECDNTWEDQSSWSYKVDTSAAGAVVTLADGTVNSVTGTNIFRILKTQYKSGSTSVQKKRLKIDGAFYSYQSMAIQGEARGTGVLNITAGYEGMNSELHLTVNGGNVNIFSQDDGINVNEDGVSALTVNGGNLHILAGLGSEGDGIDSNGFIAVNGGTVITMANPGADSGMDSDGGTYVFGGNVIALGATMDWATNDSSVSYDQAIMNLQFSSSKSAGDAIVITDSNGKGIFAYDPDKDEINGSTVRTYTGAIIASEHLTIGQSYQVYIGGEVTGTETMGVYDMTTVTAVSNTYRQSYSSTGSSGGRPTPGGSSSGSTGSGTATFNLTNNVTKFSGVTNYSGASNITVTPMEGGSTECSHSYTSKVTTAATCTASGVRTYTCSLCGDSYTQAIPATGHSYANGACTVCGAADPSVPTVNTYYLVGFINGANHGCEDDYENMGSYRFADGKLTATFTDDSYVFLKTEGNGKWLLAESYCTDTTCTFVEGGTEKMFVPGNVEVTFTLTENTDGSVSLSYEAAAAECSHSYHCTLLKEATCNSYATYAMTCSACGDYYTVTADALGNQWLDAIPGGMTGNDFESRTLYRYRDQAAGAGVWTETGSSTDYYVNQWPSGFDTSNSLYSQYNNIGSKATAYENDAEKLVIHSDEICGYLYYHWCRSGYPYTAANKSFRYNRFHAYYSTKTPDQADQVDTSDNSYRFDDSTACSSSKWYFAVPVYAQSYTTYSTTAAADSWSDWSDWSTTAVTASETRQVETTLQYRYTQAALADHRYTNGACSNCGAADPDHGVPSSTTYYLVGYINGADHGCESDYENMGQYQFVDGKLTATFTTDSYVFVKTEGNGKWLLADGYCTDTTCTFSEGKSEKMFVPGNVQITFTLNENADGSVTLSYTTGSGAASTVPTLTLKAPTLEFKDMICVIAFYTAENIEDVVEMGMITYSSKVDTWNIATAENVIPGASYDDATGRYYSSSQGIHAKYLGDAVYLAIYAKLADGTYAYSKLASYSAVTYATNQLKNSTDTALKQLAAAMLNYGAEAQTYFGHNTSALANASLSAEQKALPETYRDDMVSSVPAASVAKQGSFANNQGFASRKPAISFEGAFCINYFFTPNYAPDSGITLYYWNAEDYNAASVLTTANASGFLTLEGSGTGEYRGDITGISAKALSEAVYVAAVYTNGGTTWTSGVLGYSIGSYCVSQASKGGDIANLAMATAVYGYHAKQYFG